MVCLRAFTADIDGSSVLVNGNIDMDDVSNFDVFVQANEIDTTGIMSFVPLRKDLVVSEGKFTRFYISILKVKMANML